MMVETLEKVEIPPAETLAEFPLQYSLVLALFLVFRCFYGALLEESLGVLYIEGF
jgi:hypothetical protein